MSGVLVSKNPVVCKVARLMVMGRLGKEAYSISKNDNESVKCFEVNESVDHKCFVEVLESDKR